MKNTLARKYQEIQHIYITLACLVAFSPEMLTSPLRFSLQVGLFFYQHKLRPTTPKLYRWVEKPAVTIRTKARQAIPQEQAID